MKKSILVMAVAASMAASTAAVAEPTVYGNVHLSINTFGGVDGPAGTTVPASKPDNGKGGGVDEWDMTSNTSAIGVKGSEDLGDGLKAIYKAEFQMNAADGGEANDTNDEGTAGNALTQRDIFAGLKGGWGTLKLGTMSSNYKQMGGKVDALYRTNVEGRGFLNTQSSQLHGGRGVNRGRQTNTLQYVSPKMAGIQLVVNTTLSGAGDGEEETTGAGLRWSNKSILAYVDWIDGDSGKTDPTSGNAIAESAVKVGAKFSSKAFFIAGQYEDAEDRTNYNYIHLNGGFNINKNNAIIATYGTAAHITDSAEDTTGYALAYNHKLSKMTNVYAAYGARTSDTNALEDDVISFGIKKKF